MFVSAVIVPEPEHACVNLPNWLAGRNGLVNVVLWCLFVCIFLAIVVVIVVRVSELTQN